MTGPLKLTETGLLPGALPTIMMCGKCGGTVRNRNVDRSVNLLPAPLAQAETALRLSCHHSITHDSNRRLRKRLAGALQIGYFLGHDRSHEAKCFLSGVSVANTSIGKKVRAIADVSVIFLAPLHVAEILVFRPHGFTECSAILTCFS